MQIERSIWSVLRGITGIVDNGIAAKCSGSALRLWLYLIRSVDRHSTRRFRATDAEIVESVGGSKGALCGARKQLLSFGVVEFTPSKAGVYTYEICDHDTGKPYLCDPKVKPPYVKPHSRKPRVAKIKPAMGGRKKRSGDALVNDESGTAFPYGCNLRPHVQDVSPLVPMEDKTDLSAAYNPFRNHDTGGSNFAAPHAY